MMRRLEDEPGSPLRKQSNDLSNDLTSWATRLPRQPSRT